MPRKSGFKTRYATAVFIFGLSCLFYICTLSPTISVGDSPELISSAATLGIAHPPGYPLFSLLGKGFSFIPIGDKIAYRINLLSAFLGGVSVLFLYLSILEAIGLIKKSSGSGRGLSLFTDTPPQSPPCQGGDKRGGRIGTVPDHPGHIPAVLGALIFAVSPVFWSQSVTAEVYTLNAALFTGLFWLSLRWMGIQRTEVKKMGRWEYGNNFSNSPPLTVHGSRLLYLISFLWGLSLGNHHTMFAFGPIFFLFAVVYWFVGARRRLALGGSPTRPYNSLLTPHSSLLALFFLLGLSVYLYLPIRSVQNPFMDWGDTERLAGFLEVILRKQFGLGSRDYSFERGVMQAGYYFTLLREQFTAPGLFLGITGALFFVRRTLLPFLFTLAIFLTYGIITTIFLNPARIDQSAVNVMVIPSLAVFSIWVGIGLLFAYRGIAALFSRGLTAGRERGINIILTLFFLLIPAATLYSNISGNDQSGNTFAYDYANDIFEGIEPNGVLFVDTDLSLFPLWYMQYVEGKKRDVAVLNVDMLMLPWFKGQLRDKYPSVVIRVPDVIRHAKGGRFKPLSMEALVIYKVSQVEEILNTILDRRSVYMSYDFGVPFKKFGERKDIHVVQKGIIFRVLKEAAPEETISNFHVMRSILKAIESGDEEVLFIARGYIPAMETAASGELAEGQKDTAIKWMEAILAVDPYNASSLNNLAFLYAEKDGDLALAEQMVKKALAVNPRERGRYLKTLGYIYLKKGKYMMAKETFAKALEMEPGSEWSRKMLEEVSSKILPPQVKGD